MPRQKDLPPRAHNGRFTAVRTTTVTERYTVEQPPTPVPPDPEPTRTSYVFADLIRRPPGQRWAHPGFIADMAARDAAQASVTAAHRGPAPTVVVTAPRVYHELEPETLAHEFTDADRERLVATLGELPELTP